jgi:hypothetical protein
VLGSGLYLWVARRKAVDARLAQLASALQRPDKADAR